MGEIVPIRREQTKAPTGSGKHMWLCALGFHKRSMWLDISEGDLYSNGRCIGVYIKQERRCLRCNAVELRRKDML